MAEYLRPLVQSPVPRWGKATFKIEECFKAFLLDLALLPPSMAWCDLEKPMVWSTVHLTQQNGPNFQCFQLSGN